MIFFGVQALIGFGLDKYYYKDVFTSTKYIGITILIIGVIYTVYSYYLQNKDSINIDQNQQKIHRFFFYKQNLPDIINSNNYFSLDECFYL